MYIIYQTLSYPFSSLVTLPVRVLCETLLSGRLLESVRSMGEPDRGELEAEERLVTSPRVRVPALFQIRFYQ